ncbi:MAG: hypothetical protein ACYSU0_21390 [Planctomycetota bacterium]
MRIAYVVAAVALASPAAAAESASSHAEAAATPRRRPRFVVEYLPAFAYERESISLRFRVENPGREPADCTVEVVLSPAAGEKASPEPPAPVRMRVLPGKKRSGGVALPVSGWSRAEVRFDAGGRVPAASAGKDARAAPLVIRRFPEDKDIPPLRAAGDRLYVRTPKAKAPPAGTVAISGGPPSTARTDGPGPAAGDEAAVLTLPQRVGEDDREWLIVKRLAERFVEGTRPAGVLLLGAGLAEARRSPVHRPARETGGGEVREPSYIRAVREGAGTWVEAAALPGEGASGVTYPILADFAAALGRLESTRPAELVVWVVACDDARRGTPKRTFRKAVDFLLRRVRRRSARMEVLFVPEPAVPPKRRALYSEALRKAALAYQVTFRRLDALERHRFWTGEASGSTPPLMRYPNAEGHEALAEAVLERIRP